MRKLFFSILACILLFSCNVAPRKCEEVTSNGSMSGVLITVEQVPKEKKIGDRISAFKVNNPPEFPYVYTTESDNSTTLFIIKE